MKLALRNEARPGKYGIVTLFRADGSVEREWRITGEQLERVNRSCNLVPPGCSRRDWEAGPSRAILRGYG